MSIKVIQLRAKLYHSNLIFRTCTNCLSTCKTCNSVLIVFNLLVGYLEGTTTCFEKKIPDQTLLICANYNISCSRCTGVSTYTTCKQSTLYKEALAKQIAIIYFSPVTVFVKIAQVFAVTAHQPLFVIYEKVLIYKVMN